jgi:hypothetical protein
MILGMSPLLAFHLALSFFCILAGKIVLWGFVRNRRFDMWTMLFLASAVIVDLSGFPLPPFGIDPPRILGIISLVVLMPAVAARYAFGMRGIWRPVFVITASMTLWFNIFVLIVQAFEKIPPLHALAPNGNEPPFAIVQGVALVLFVIWGFLSVRRFHPV